MRIPTYTATPGLDRYPKSDRFAVYRAAHQRLLREDGAYRRHFNSYALAVICLALIPIVGWVALIFLAFRQQDFQNRRIGELLQPVA